jgi:signal transduction histidine kinase
MTTTGTGRQPASTVEGVALAKGRSPLAHLLHALNQPLTGLQCSLELAVSGPRPLDQYVRTLRDGLELAGRMRLLVEAMRELVDAQEPAEEQDCNLRLDAVLNDTVEELRPVAAARNVQLHLERTAMLPVRASWWRVRELLFRLLDSVISQAREASKVELSTTRAEGECTLSVRWIAGTPPAHSPFSAAELGLFMVQAGWERAGGDWKHTEEETLQTLTLRLPLAEILPESEHLESTSRQEPASCPESAGACFLGNGLPGGAR